MPVINSRVHLKPGPSTLKFRQGKIGGGGFAYRLQIAPDGSLLVSANTPNIYMKPPGTSAKWVNLSVSPNMDAIGIGPGNFATPLYHGWAPDSLRIFSIFQKLNSPMGPDRGAYHMSQTHGAVYGSDDKGATWYMTGLQNIAGFSPIAPGGAGPLIWFDPLNRDVCYVMDPIGVVRRTLNGGTTWTIVSALLSLLPTATVVGNYFAGYGGATVTVNSNPVVGAGGANSWGVYDVTNPLALGTDPNFSLGFGGTSTTINCGPLATKDGSVGSGASVQNGDVLRFGLAGGIVIDPSGGSVANPGGTGVISKIVYFGWSLGASGIYRTTDGDPEHATLITGSPASIGRMMLSNDATLGGGGHNTLYFGSNTTDPFWRYVPLTAPTGSGLTANTFLNLLGGSAPDGWATFAPDPKTQGRVLLISGRGHTYLSTNYGGTFSGASEGNFPTMVAGNGGTNAPWMTTNDPIQIGDALFDPVLTNVLWMCNGNGIWWKNPATGTTTWTTAMDDLQSLIITQTMKTPAPNGRVYITCQDHVYIYANDALSNVTCDYGNVGNPTNGYGMDYCAANPNQVFISAYSSGKLLFASDGHTFNPVADSQGPPNPIPRGGVSSVGAITGGTLYTPASGTATYNGVALTGGSGSAATANITVTNGAVTAVVMVNRGDFFYDGEALSAASANIGGTGSGFSFVANVAGSFLTTNGSPTVIGTLVNHGFTSEIWVRFIGTVGAFNGVNLEDKVLPMTVVDAHHLSLTAPTNATASGWGGGVNYTMGRNGCYPSNYIGIGTAKMAVVTPSVGTTNVWLASGTYAQYGTFDGTHWKFDYSLLAGAKLTVSSGGPYSIRNNVTKTDAGVIYYLDTDNGTGKLYKSTDFGATLTVVSTPGVFIFGAPATLLAIPGNPLHLLIAPGASGEGVADVNNAPLQVSVDGGSSFLPMANTACAVTVMAGLNAVGGAYPSIYMIGRTTADAAISSSASYMYRSDDFNPVARTCTWQRLDGSKTVNCDGWLGGFSPDPEVAGTFYIGTNDTGYLQGYLG